MGFFNLSSQDGPVMEEVEFATTEKNVEENWGIIMNICDKAGKSSEDAKSYLRAIIKRLANEDPHIGVKAVTLLDACVKNSGRLFHIELASRDFETEFMRLMNKGNAVVAKKLRESLKRWSENEFKSDGQLSLIPSLYAKLKSEGFDFSSSEPPVKKAGPQIKDPNFVESQEEEDQILKAIELSLKESGSPRAAASSASHTSTSLYPSVNMASSGLLNSATPAKEPRKVRALYDFEAAEDNELTFSTGEIIVVTDDSDPNWWKGSNHRGEGLFPANFVTSDLNVEPEKFLYEKAKKMVQFKETTDVKEVKEETLEVEINEEKINRLLHLLHEADPTNPEKDTEEMLKLEREVNNMGPLIDSELERVDRKHAQLTQLSADLVEALGLYHTLMREPQFPIVNKMPYGYPSSSQQMPYMPPDMPPHMMAGHQPNYPFHSVQHGYPGHPGPLPQHHGSPSQPIHANPNVRPNYPGITGPPPPHHIPQHHLDKSVSAPHHYPMMSMPMDVANRSQMGIQMPHQMQPPPQMHDLDQRLHEQQPPQHQQQPPPGMPPLAMGPVVPNFGMPQHMMQQQPQFVPTGHLSQTQMPNGPQMQGGAPPHFVPSSGHITQ